MSWELLFVLALLIFALVNFIWEKLPIDVTAILLFSALLVGSIFSHSGLLPTVDGLILVFANSAPLTIAAMFIISLALDRCGFIEILAQKLGKLTSLPYGGFILVLVVGVGAISAFINNTPVVVVFMPVIISLARKMNTPASKLLIPLSYASIFGGVCTLMGTSTNILMSGIITQYDQAPLGMFEISVVGIPLLCVGTAYLMIFGKRILPTRETLTAILSEEERKEYITEAFVRKDSSLIGKSFSESALKKNRGMRILEVVRDGVALTGDAKLTPLAEGDRLVLASRPSAIASARSNEDLDLAGEQGLDLETIAAHEGAIIEGVIGPMSSLVGKSIRDINFRQRYRMIVLAVHRNGRNVREKLETIPLDFGDTLLMMGTDKAIENLRKGEDIILLDHGTLPAKDMTRKMPLVIGLIAAMIAAVSFANVPIVAASIIVVALLFLSGTIKPKEAYAAIEWRILVLIYGMLALGQALETTGATGQAAGYVVAMVQTVPIDMQPYIMLIFLYLITTTVTELLSNNATVVLMGPLSISIAATLGVDPRPFIIAVCIASSASFSTPIGYQTNTYVYGVGGYRFSDFLKIGIPLNLIYFVCSVLMIPLFWSF